MTLPDRFIAHGTPQGMYEDAGMTTTDIVKTALATLGISQVNLLTSHYLRKNYQTYRTRINALNYL